MSDAAPTPWVPLTVESAKSLQGASIEARRGDGEVERHETGVVYQSLGESWMQIGGLAPRHAWSNGLRIDGLWEVRQLGHVLHKDAAAFAGSLESPRP